MKRALVALGLVSLLGGVARAAVDPPPSIDASELHQGDRIRVVLRHGGELVGNALALDERRGELHVHVASEVLRVDTAIVAWIELLQRWDEATLRRVEEALDGEEARQRRARARARAAGLAVGSFFVPGLGQFALGQPGLGATYLLGTLVVDAAIVLSLAINQNPFVAAILGALELAARITSASLAARRARMMAVWIAPDTGGPVPGGVVVGVVGRFPARARGREGTLTLSGGKK